MKRVILSLLLCVAAVTISVSNPAQAVCANFTMPNFDTSLISVENSGTVKVAKLHKRARMNRTQYRKRYNQIKRRHKACSSCR